VQQFHGDRTLPGRTIRLDKQDVLVAGVLPRGFRSAGPGDIPQVWMPEATWKALTGDHFRDSRGRRGYDIFARLKNGVSIQQANSEVAAIGGALAQEYPATNAHREMSAASESQVRSGAITQMMLALLAISALVLLIACANVASLLLARAEYRRHELATRVALGASRAQLFRQLIVETVVLGAAASAAALLLGVNLVSALPALIPHPLTTAVDTHMDGRVFFFSLLAALVSMLVFGVVPAWQAVRTAPATFLKQHGSDTGHGRALGRAALVLAQVAISVVLVVSAGLLVRSAIKATTANPGFDAHQNLLIMEITPGNKTSDVDRQNVDEARRRLEALPGVQGTAVGMHIPFSLSGSGATRKVFVSGGPEEGIVVHFDPVGDRYFDVLGTRLLRGRVIAAGDEHAGARVLVVNRTMAQRFWPGRDPVGQLLRLDKADSAPYQIIGEVEDAKNEDMVEDPTPFLFIPMTADDYGETVLMVKTAGDAGALAAAARRVLLDVSPNVDIIYSATMRQHMRMATSDERFVTGLIASLSGLGLLLAAVGLYGLTAFLVGRRTQEIGIRVALGAQRGAIFAMVIRRALLLTVAGVAVGALAAIPATSALRAFLFGVTPHDAGAYLGALVVLVAVGCAAALVPALRATRVDPMEALHYE
jgi:putative ABC transport system permease protein